jgi:hypothetical protein
MKILSCMILVLAVACGGNNGGGDDGGDDDGGGDGGMVTPDAMIPVPASCVNGPIPTNPECSDCIDNDGDGEIDTFDVQCSGPLDDAENSFATGIPGDNMDAVNQDCFFDGNSGAGNDGCNIHVCCLLGAPDKASCPIGANQYNPMECPPPIGTTPLSQMCIDVCGALAPPGCDCFGCCTICNDTACADVIINPQTSPNCTPDTITDPAFCKACTKVPSCGSTQCGGDTCILCPGQTPDDLPTSCGGMTQCPSGSQSCANGEACPAMTYCNETAKCCVGIIGLH